MVFNRTNRRKGGQSATWLNFQLRLPFRIPFVKRTERKPEQRSPQSRPRRTKRESDPELLALWCQIAHEFFPDRTELKEYQIRWSNRNQKRTLASCNVFQKRVNVARELNYEAYTLWLAPLLYHEMCHAVLGVEPGRVHDKRFKRLESRHPEMKAFDRWIKEGGWARAVRSDRAKRAHARRQMVSNG